MKKHNLLFLLLSLILCVGSFPLLAHAASPSDRSADFQVDEEGRLEKYTGPGGDVVIPDVAEIVDKARNSPTSHYAYDSHDFYIKKATLIKYEGPGGDVVIPTNVIIIGSYAFYDCDTLTSVIIPDNVRYIQESAFGKCANLKTVTIGSKVTNIDKDIFIDCPSLEEIKVASDNPVFHSEDGFLLKGDTVLGGTASAVLAQKLADPKYVPPSDDFEMDRKTLTKYVGPGGDVMIPSDVLFIGEAAFADCESLTSVTLSDDVSQVYDRAFLGCSNLKKITFGRDMKALSLSSLAYCPSLTTFEVSPDNPVLTVRDGFLISKSGERLLAAPVGQNLVIPEGVTTICLSAFDTNPLRQVTIPDSVTKIEMRAFLSCENLTQITLSKNLESIGSHAFSGTPLTSVTIPDTVESLGASVFSHCTSLRQIHLSENLAEISPYLFSECYSLEQVNIPKGVTSIGKFAFANCRSLTSLTIPEGVTSIDDYAFIFCTHLTSLSIPASLTQIGNCLAAFEDDPDRVIYGPAGSYIEQYAKEHHINFVVGSAPAPAPIDTTPTPVGIAYPSTQMVRVDDAPVEFQMYALKDDKGDLTNYIKLRDLAYILNGTAAQFSVTWENGGIVMDKGKPYIPNGTEMSTPFSGEWAYTKPAAKSLADAIVLTDDKGGGYTYYQLRDVGKVLDFNVGWSADKGVYIETDKPYDPNN